MNRAGIYLYNARKVADMRQGVRHLLKGEFDKGWPLYKSRNQIHWYDRRFKVPYWEGEDIAGKTLLLMYEQGLGEQIYFSAIVPELLNKGINVILEVDDRLVTLMQRSFPAARVIPYQFPPDEACYTADLQCFLGTAFGYLRPNFESYPAQMGYLIPDASRASDVYASDIGLSWFSNAQFYAKSKNIPLDLWEPLLQNEHKSVVSVQYGEVNDPRIYHPDFDITQDLENAAALISRCSTIVTVSNTVAHLAGALGVETHVLVPNALGRHFYWYPERETVPNYPSASAYLQMPAGDWKPCVDYITKKVLDKTS